MTNQNNPSSVVKVTNHSQLAPNNEVEKTQK